MQKSKKFLSAISYQLSTISGFTFIELLMGLGVVTILTGFLLAAINPIDQIKKARDSRRKKDLEKMQTALEDYNNDQGHYPSTFISGGRFAPYLTEIPSDPKNEIPYIYYYATDGSTRPSWYKIYVRLEYEADPVSTKAGCEDGCGPDGLFNYWVSSPNVALAQKLPDENWPWPPEGPLPTATPEPTPTTPVSTPTPTSIPTPTSTPKPWWNIAWTKRRKITFNNSGQSENLINFPVLIKLDSSRIDYSYVQNDYDDLRFIDENDLTVLDYEVEEWNEFGTSYVWVEVSQIDGSSNTDFIWMYYGNPSASSGQAPEGVWDSNFKMVQHLDESPNDNVKGHLDSTSNNNNGTPRNFQDGGGGSTAATGKIAGADQFAGDDDYIDCGSNSSVLPDVFTVEVWIKTTAANLNPLVGWTTSDARPVVAAPWSPTNNRPIIYLGLENYRYFNNSPTDIRDGGWHYLVFVVTGNSQGDINNSKMYADGQEETVNITSSSSSPLTKSVCLIGRVGSFAYYNNGTIDEVRISNTTRSADWIAAQYDSMIDSFASFGSEESY